MYFVVADLDEGMKRCREKGGEVIVVPMSMGSAGRFFVIRDPAGAVAALFCPAAKDWQG